MSFENPSDLQRRRLSVPQMNAPIITHSESYCLHGANRSAPSACEGYKRPESVSRHEPSPTRVTGTSRSSRRANDLRAHKIDSTSGSHNPSASHASDQWLAPRASTE